jgi:CheY-like chemotaxis protein
LILLDLMMPDVSGFDVVHALHAHPDTARIPILVITAKQITEEDRVTLDGSVTTIMEKAELDRDRFVAEVQRAMSGRLKAAGHGNALRSPNPTPPMRRLNAKGH